MSPEQNDKVGLSTITDKYTTATTTIDTDIFPYIDNPINGFVRPLLKTLQM